jgi:hypothetical protein
MSGIRALTVASILVLLSAGRMSAAVPVAAASPAPQGARQMAPGAYSLRVTTQPVTTITLDALQARLVTIAAELGRRLGVQVLVGPSLADELISANFADLTIEAALPLLAPRVLIDYEMRQGQTPTALAVHLLTFADPAPPENVGVHAPSQGVFIEGNTEDTGDRKRDDPLQASYARGLLTLAVREQPLQTVIMVVSDMLGVPADVRYDAMEIISADIFELPPEDALQRLSPNIRVYVRADLNLAARTVVRIVVAPRGASAGR